MAVSPHVLVTRPRPGADATAARLVEMGFSPVLLPLTRIVTVEPRHMPDPDGCEALAVTSANALRHAPAALVAALAGKPLFAVGDATAAHAKGAGFRDVRSAAGAATDLAAMIRAALPLGARVVHLAGTERTAGFAEELERDGFGVLVVETYEAEEIGYSLDYLRDAFTGRAIWGAPVFSTRGGALLAELARRPPVTEAFELTRFFCISEKAAAPLRALAGERVSVSPAPSEKAVLALLRAGRAETRSPAPPD